MSQQKIYTKRENAYNKRNLEHICHKTVNMAVFFVETNENTYPKGRALMKMYIVFPK